LSPKSRNYRLQIYPFQEITKREIENLVTPEFLVEKFKEFLGPELSQFLNPEALKGLLSKPRETKREPVEKPEIKHTPIKEPVQVQTKSESQGLEVPPEILEYHGKPKIPKEVVLPWLNQSYQTGYGFKDMATALNNAGIPTTSGRGQWQRGTIGNMVDK
jgi:hypothetical protein